MIATFQIDSHCQVRVEAIESYLQKLLSSPEVPTAQLNEAARYSALAGGKRLRPLLCLLTAEMYGISIATAIPIACAFELIHTYSLIHDDLPAMDDDDLRRGKPTLHKVYSDGHAILTGDFLLTYAFEVIASTNHLSPPLRLALIQLLAKSSGACGMVGGQALDLAAEGSPLTLSELQTIHHHKTGKLIEASITAGALIGNGTEDELQALSSFGNHFGLAFQIVDDLLDIVDSKGKRGQERSSDLANKKSTYATLLGFEEAFLRAQQSRDAMIDSLSSLSLPSHYLLALTTTAIDRLKG